MKDLAVKNKLFSIVLALITIVIVLLPFHAFLTVWAASLFGHYTLFRLWKEFLVLFCGLFVIYLFFIDKKVRQKILKDKLVWVILAYVILDFIVGGVAFFTHKVTTKALAYGLLDDLRFLAFFIICWAVAICRPELTKRWQKMIIWPALIVVLFGLLEMSVLPINFLAHFGYSAKTIPPYQTINNNIHFVRILSTLRGANPLGAYLILPISAIAVLFVKSFKSWNWAKALFFIGSIVVLVGSYSRSAWIGAFLSCVVLALTLISKSFIKRFKVPIIVTGIVILGLVISSFVLLGKSTRFQDIVFHTQAHSASPVSSDQAHISALITGIKQVELKPLGRGPGSSGPASFYNHDGVPRVPENYFLEVGEESGFLGMALFIAINILVGYRLWQRRDADFALTLFVSLVGITFVNLLLLAWTDDTLSYIWWGLAGLAMAIPPAGKVYVAKPKSIATTK